jgi:hypothetical protein
MVKRLTGRFIFTPLTRCQIGYNKMAHICKKDIS